MPTRTLQISLAHLKTAPALWFFQAVNQNCFDLIETATSITATSSNSPSKAAGSPSISRSSLIALLAVLTPRGLCGTPLLPTLRLSVGTSTTLKGLRCCAGIRSEEHTSELQ